MSSRLLAALAVGVTVTALAACGADDPSAGTPSVATTGEDTAASDAAAPEGPVTVYSGRSEELVAPLYEQFTADTGVEVEVRYGDSAELAAQLLEEGERSRADVFVSQDAGALGALGREGLFTELPPESLDAVPERFRAEDGTWVGVSGRARVLVYNPDEVAAEELPTSVFDLTDQRWAGRVAWAPTNASFQAFVTAMRVIEGEDATREWLTAMQANGTQAYERNGLILDAVDSGDAAFGLVNHYYWYEKVAEEGDITAELQFLDPADPGALVNVAGAGVLAASPNPEGAQQLVDYLLSDEGQTFFAENTQEYPLIEGVEAQSDLPPLDEVAGPAIDLSDLESLQETLDLLAEVGVV